MNFLVGIESVRPYYLYTLRRLYIELTGPGTGLQQIFATYSQSFSSMISGT